MKPIRRVAVLGAGTMGSRIAAHFANAGVPTLLLDIVLPNQPNRNAAALKGLDTALKQKPGAFFTPEAAALITPGNFEDNLGAIRQCDWIIEAVAENLGDQAGSCGAKWKRCARRTRSSPPTRVASRWPASPKGSAGSFAATSWARTSSIHRAIFIWWR